MAKKKTKFKTTASKFEVYKANYPIIKLDQTARVYIRDDHIIAIIFEKITVPVTPDMMAKDASLLANENIDSWIPLKDMGFATKVHLPISVRSVVFTETQIEYEHNDGLYHITGVVRYNHNEVDDTIGKNERKGPQKWLLAFNNETNFPTPYNIYPGSKIFKDKQSSTFLGREKLNSIVFVFVPYEDSPLSECIILVSNKCWVNTPFKECEQGMPGIFVRPTLEIVGNDEVKGNTNIDLKVKMTPEHPRGTPVEVFLETTAGYISKQRYKVGVDTGFAFMPLGLLPGDEARIKVGWANYTGIAEKTIKVKP